MSDIEVLRKSLTRPVDALSAEEKREVALDTMAQIISAIETGACAFGDWEKRHLTMARSALLGGKYDEARSAARRAIWPEVNRRLSGVADVLKRVDLRSLPELNSALEAGRSAQPQRSPHPASSAGATKLRETGVAPGPFQPSLKDNPTTGKRRFFQIERWSKE